MSPSRPTEHSAPVQLTQEQVEAARAGRGKHRLGDDAKTAKAANSKTPAGKSPTRRKRS